MNLLSFHLFPYFFSLYFFRNCLFFLVPHFLLYSQFSFFVSSSFLFLIYLLPFHFLQSVDVSCFHYLFPSFLLYPFFSYFISSCHTFRTLCFSFPSSYTNYTFIVSSFDTMHPELQVHVSHKYTKLMKWNHDGEVCPSTRLFHFRNNSQRSWFWLLQLQGWVGAIHHLSGSKLYIGTYKFNIAKVPNLSID